MRRAALGLSVGFSCLLALGACSSESDDESEDDSDATGQGGTPGAAGAAATGGTPAAGHGKVILYAPPLSDAFTVNAGFYAMAPPDMPACTRVAEGDCYVTQCDFDPSTPIYYPHAGTINVTSAEVGFTAQLTPAADGAYGEVAGAWGQTRFLGQETLQFVASGGQVPAFQQTMTYPLLLELSSPAAPGGQLQVARAQGLTLSWNRGVEGVELRFVTVLAGSPAGGTLDCEVPSVLGSVYIPPTLLQLVGPNALVKPISAAVQTIQVGDYLVDVVAAGEVVTLDHTAAIEIQLL
jgi:hypothetical protein